jgi:transcriptional regulator with XRE-family HTH domain
MSPLKRRRLVLGLTQAGVAKAARVTTGAVCSWENGEREPKAENIPHLAHALQVSPESLVDMLIDLSFSEWR